jgi:hypothetical protein
VYRDDLKPVFKLNQQEKSTCQMKRQQPMQIRWIHWVTALPRRPITAQQKSQQ